jgi:hypothetical protein
MTYLKTLGATFVAAVAATLICSPASAFEITFDENGNGCLDNSDHICTTPLVSTTAPDPTGRVAGDVLIYTLPSLVLEGDVGITDFGTNTLSDVLTFTDANGGLSGTGDLMIFYSELGGSDLADSGFPDQEFFIGAAEGANGNFTYNAGNIYNGISPEGVPEPITLSLFGVGLVGAAALRRRKTKSL